MVTLEVLDARDWILEAESIMVPSDSLILSTVVVPVKSLE